MGNIVLRKNRVTANTLIGKVGELTINTTDKTLYIHDGSTAGGFSLFRYNTSSAITSGEVPFSNGTQGVLQTSSNLKWTSPNLLINTYKAFHAGNFVSGTGVSITESPTNTFTVANTGVLSVVAGTAISISGATGNVTINNTGVTSNVAGTGISVSGATGAVTITNSDRGSSQNIFKTINVVDGSDVAVTNSPITASSNSSSLTFKQGTGITFSVTGSTITVTSSGGSGSSGVTSLNGLAGALTLSSSDFNISPSGTDIALNLKTTISPTFSNISITNVADFGDGSVSAPSITNTGDLNTGIYFPAADTVSITTGGVQNLTVEPDGDVVIGSIASPLVGLRNLDIYNTDTTTGSGSIVRLISSDSSGTGYGVVDLVRYKSGQFTIANSDTLDSPIAFNTGGFERLRIDKNGLVGIGTVSPNCALEVKSGTSTFGLLRVVNSNTNGESSVGFRDSSDADAASWVMGKNVAGVTDDSFAWYYNGTKMTLLTSGNLGIGTATPGTALDVTGTVRASSQLISTVTTGTAPLAVSSTTKVNNLNADLLDGYDSTQLLDYNNLTNKPTIGNGTLTLAVSGTGLSGSQTFTANQSGNATFTVTLNSSTSGVSNIVARDASGNFSAGTITATSFSGALSNTLTLNTSGTGLSGSATFNNSSASTFTVTLNSSTSGVSNIVARDASGNFSAGTITASLSGNATTATTATSVSNSITFDNSGTGAVSGSNFNGSAARTISYNTIGAPSTTGTNASGSWGISVTGSSASCTGNAATATVLYNFSTFSLTGDVTASGVSFNGSGNVQLSTIIGNGTVTSAKLASSLSLTTPTLSSPTISGVISSGPQLNKTIIVDYIPTSSNTSVSVGYGYTVNANSITLTLPNTSLADGDRISFIPGTNLINSYTISGNGNAIMNTDTSMIVDLAVPFDLIWNGTNSRWVLG